MCVMCYIRKNKLVWAEVPDLTQFRFDLQNSQADLDQRGEYPLWQILGD